MAPKRAAKKAAPPPPPPPPAESSDDETRSGSRSRSDDSEDEEAIAQSAVPAATPALKNTPAASQKGGESESSDDEEEDDDEEEEEPAPAAPNNQPPPQQKKQDSDSSGSDDEEEEDEEEEPARAPPPSAPKKQPPQPQKIEDSGTSGDEEDDEEEAPPPKPAPKKEPEALKPLPPAADEAKKPAGVHRIWSIGDEVRILEALAAHQKQHGTFPQPDALIDVLAGKLDNPAYGSKELQSKVKSLRHRYLTLSRRGEVPSKDHDRRILDLSKIVWEGDKTPTAGNNGHGQKGFEEMCALYPYLAEEVKELEARLPGVCKREFGKMDDDKARAMDEKIKRLRVTQIRVEMRRGDLAKEVTKAIVDLVDG